MLEFILERVCAFSWGYASLPMVFFFKGNDAMYDYKEPLEKFDDSMDDIRRRWELPCFLFAFLSALWVFMDIHVLFGFPELELTSLHLKWLVIGWIVFGLEQFWDLWRESSPRSKS